MLHPSAALPYEGEEGCSTVDTLVPVARREPAPRLPPQPIVTIEESSAPMRRFSEVVGRCSGSSSWSFFHWFLNGVVSCRTSKQVSGVVFSPPALFFQQQWHQVLGCGPLTATPPHKKALRSLKMIINSVNYSYALAYSCWPNMFCLMLLFKKVHHQYSLLFIF